MNKSIKNPPKGGNQSSWNFKPCKYKKVIIKKNQYRILPNGDIEIMAREDTIGFKTTRRKPRKPGNGGSGGHNDDNKKTTKQLLIEFMKEQRDYNAKNDLNIADIKKGVNNIEKRVGKLETGVGKLEIRVTKLENK